MLDDWCNRVPWLPWLPFGTPCTWAAAVGDDERALVLGEDAGQFILTGFETNRAGDVSLLPCLVAVGVDDHHFLASMAV